MDRIEIVGAAAPWPIAIDDAELVDHLKLFKFSSTAMVDPFVEELEAFGIVTMLATTIMKVVGIAVSATSAELGELELKFIVKCQSGAQFATVKTFAMAFEEPNFECFTKVDFIKNSNHLRLILGFVVVTKKVEEVELGIAEEATVTIEPASVISVDSIDLRAIRCY